MVEIRRPNARKPANKSKSGSMLPKVVIGVLIVLLLGNTFLTTPTTTTNTNTTTNGDSSMGISERLEDSRGNLRPKAGAKAGARAMPPLMPGSGGLGIVDRIQEAHEDEESPSSPEEEEEEAHDSEKNKEDPEEKEPPSSPEEEEEEESAKEEKKESSSDGGEGANEENMSATDERRKTPDIHRGVVEVKKQFLPPIPGAAKFEAITSQIGTGPTNMAYVKDFDQERANPAFRMVTDKAKTTMEEKSASLLTEIATMVDESSVTPCRTTTTTTTADPKCSDTDTPLIVYNSASFERTWCNTKVAPLTAVKLAADCDRSGEASKQPAHLFSTDVPPTISGQGQAPMIIKSHASVDVANPKDVEQVECNIPCQQEKGMDGTRRVIDGTPWSLEQTMNDNAKMERTSFRNDQYYSTQSWLSDIPLSLFDFNKYSMRQPAVDWDKAQNKGVYLVNTACSSQSTKRQKYFGATANNIKVDAIGTCHHNAEVPDGMTMDTIDGRVAIMKQYRMVLAFDAISEKDRISEIIWEAYMSGAVPIVIGADNLQTHLPPHSAIMGGEFTDWDAMAIYVKQVAENKTLWESYHTWRNDESLIRAFEEKYKFTKTDPTCRMCRWAYAKKFGLGWDHGKQEVVEAKLPRKLCVCSSNKKGLVSKPFEEGWAHRVDHKEEESLELVGSAASDTGTCTSVPTVEGVIAAKAYKVHRTIHQHDGITDIIITGVERKDHEGQVVLRLDFPGMRNSEGAFFRNPHTLVPTKGGALVTSASMQDEFAKVTILADWVTSISSLHASVMEVVVQQDKEDAMPEGATKRIRVFTEDLNVIHDKMTEFFPTSFAKVATKDFIDPLELFYADS